MATTPQTGALSSPHVTRAKTASQRKKQVIADSTKTEDIDTKAFEEAEANIKALADQTTPKKINPIIKVLPVTARCAETIEGKTDKNSPGLMLLKQKESTNSLNTTEESADDDVDPESVLDRIFDAASSGNSEDISRLLFSKKNKNQAERLNKSDILSEDHSDESTAFKPLVEELLAAKSSCRKRKLENDELKSGKTLKKASPELKKTVDFKDIKNTSVTSPVDVKTTKPASTPVEVKITPISLPAEVKASKATSLLPPVHSAPNRITIVNTTNIPSANLASLIHPGVSAANHITFVNTTVNSSANLTSLINPVHTAANRITVVNTANSSSANLTSPTQPVHTAANRVKVVNTSVSSSANLTSLINPALTAASHITFVNTTNSVSAKFPAVPATAPLVQPAQPLKVAPAASSEDIKQTGQPPRPDSPPKVALIDYSVLTNALTKTLQNRLSSGDNDVKIVIFCNNRPIQSFSLKNNLSEISSPEDKPKAAGAGIVQASGVSGTTQVIRATESLVSTAQSAPPATAVTITQHRPVVQIENLETLNSSIGQYANFANSFSVSQPTINNSGYTVNGDNCESVKASNPKTKSKYGIKYPPIKLKIGFNKLSPQKKVASNTFLRIKGSSVNSLDKADKEQNTNDCESEEEGSKLVISTEDDAAPSPRSTDTSRLLDCEFCGKAFRLRRTLNRHKLRVHALNKTGAQKTPRVFNSAPGGSSRKRSKQRRKSDVSPGKTDEEIDIITVKTEPGLEGDITEDLEKSNNLSEKDYIQSLLADGPLQEIIQSKNTAPSTKVNTLRNVLESFEKQKQLDLPLDANGEVQPVFVCEHCGKFYRARKTLKDHFLREHAKELGEEPLYLYIAGNKYQCTICFNYFHSASELLTHTKTHTGELRSPCNICGKVYSSVHVLRRHIDNVHAEVRPRPFRCKLCDYAAANKWHLKEHHRRHTGEQPFVCPICNKSFSHQGTMNRHCKTLHGFDSSTLSREQLRLQNNLNTFLVPSVALVRSGLALPHLGPQNSSLEQSTDSSVNAGSEIDQSLVKSEPLSPGQPGSQSEASMIDMSIVKTEPVDDM